MNCTCPGCASQKPLRLVGAGYGPTASKPVPKQLWDTRTRCPQCDHHWVLPELSFITDGVCWDCYLGVPHLEPPPKPEPVRKIRKTTRRRR